MLNYLLKLNVLHKLTRRKIQRLVRLLACFLTKPLTEKSVSLFLQEKLYMLSKDYMKYIIMRYVLVRESF